LVTMPLDTRAGAKCLALIQTTVGLVALVLAKLMAGATIGGLLLCWSWEAAMTNGSLYPGLDELLYRRRLLPVSHFAFGGYPKSPARPAAT
jgi:hypothetical protein